MSATLDQLAELNKQSGSYISNSVYDNSGELVLGPPQDYNIRSSGLAQQIIPAVTTGAWTTTVSPKTITYTDPTSIKLAVAEKDIKSLKEEIASIKVVNNQLFDMISKIATDKQNELDRIREIIKA